MPSANAARLSFSGRQKRRPRQAAASLLPRVYALGFTPCRSSIQPAAVSGNLSIVVAHSDLIDRLEQDEVVGLIDHHLLPFHPHVGALLRIRLDGCLEAHVIDILRHVPMHALGDALHDGRGPEQVVDGRRIPEGQNAALAICRR